MKQILDYLNLPKLGEVIAPPVEEFAGKLVARATRRGKSDQWIAVKWNPSTLAPDICYDPNVIQGSITSIDEVYSNQTHEPIGLVSPPAPPVPLDKLSEFDLLTVAKIKEELAGVFKLKATAFIGKNKAALYADLLALRNEAADDENNDANNAGDIVELDADGNPITKEETPQVQ